MIRATLWIILVGVVCLGTLNEIMIWEVAQHKQYNPEVPKQSEYKNCKRPGRKIPVLKKSCD